MDSTMDATRVKLRAQVIISIQTWNLGGKKSISISQHRDPIEKSFRSFTPSMDMLALSFINIRRYASWLVDLYILVLSLKCTERRQYYANSSENDKSVTAVIVSVCLSLWTFLKFMKAGQQQQQQQQQRQQKNGKRICQRASITPASIFQMIRQLPLIYFSSDSIWYRFNRCQI